MMRTRDKKKEKKNEKGINKSHDHGRSDASKHGSEGILTVMIFGIDVHTKFVKAYCSPETKLLVRAAAAVEARVEA
jgi:hypothetical protein